MFKNVGVSVLSWRAHKTLNASLENYKANGMLSLFEDICLTFSEVSPDDIATAEKFNLRYKGYADNQGIQAGMIRAAQNFDTEYILFLENDCPVVENSDEIKKQITEALTLLDAGKIDIMFLRHRFKPGERFASVRKYTQYFDPQEIAAGFELHHDISRDPKWLKALRRLFYPTKKTRMTGRSVYIEEHPEQRFPAHIKKEGDIFIVDSFVLPWTNQSILLKKRFFEKMINFVEAHPKKRSPNAFPDLEVPLNVRWWRQQHFKLGIARGLFTHARLDR